MKKTLTILLFILSSVINSPADPRVFAGGVAGVEDLAKPDHSERFRSAGGGLYLHNNGWGALSEEQRRQVLQIFKGRPIGIELGFNPGRGQVYKNSYAQFGIVPEIEVANLWPNRLIGNAALPREKRITRTNVTTYETPLKKMSMGGSDWAQGRCPTCQQRITRGEAPKLLSSGLLGPVRVMTN